MVSRPSLSRNSRHRVLSQPSGKMSKLMRPPAWRWEGAPCYCQWEASTPTPLSILHIVLFHDKTWLKQVPPVCVLLLNLLLTSRANIYPLSRRCDRRGSSWFIHLPYPGRNVRSWLRLRERNVRWGVFLTLSGPPPCHRKAKMPQLSWTPSNQKAITRTPSTRLHPTQTTLETPKCSEHLCSN